MIRKIIKYLLLIVLLVISSITIAYSYWRVDFKASSNSDLYIDQDDIAENYSFNEGAKKFTTKNYTLYLFPSTIYLESYLEYLNGKSQVKPEELYGCISPILKEDGSINYDKNGLVQYQVSNSNGDDSYLEDWLIDGAPYADTYLYANASQRKAYYEDVYNNSNWVSSTNADSYLYGDPEYDQTLVSYKNYTNSEEQHNYRNLHQYDRFGYWPKIRKAEGRYLPLKIEVDENFSSNFYEQVVARPLADMGDPKGWYCYSFTLWSYVSIQKDDKGSRIGFKAPYYATNNFISNLSTGNQKFYGDGTIVNPSLSAFCPTTVSQYFDLMGDFSIYADEAGIIRLFPKFSNGKTYDEGSQAIDVTGQTQLPCGFLNGGADALRMIPSYTETSVFNQHDYYFSYLSELEKFNSVSNVGVAIMPNVSLNSYNELSFQIDTSNGYANWPGGWQTIFQIDNTSIKEFINSYGEGFYNVYLFLGDIGKSGSSQTSQLENLVSVIRTSEGKSGIFSTLSGKNLFEPKSSTVASYKSIAIAFEKVRDARIIMNIPRETSKEAFIQSKYENTNQYFRYLSENVYTTTAGFNIVENISAVTPINQRYQYCYILNDVDFTNANTPNFQIRFQKRYRDDLKFCGTSGVSGSSGDYAPNVDLIYNPKIQDNQGVFVKEQRYVNAFEYYFDARVQTMQNDTGDEQQIIFSLKNEEFKGIYNLIMIYIPNEYYSKTINGKTEIFTTKTEIIGDYITHSAGFYLFAYRQTNVFLKILANNPTQYYNVEADHENYGWNGFLIHSGSLNNNMLLFQKEYALGVAVRGTDKNEGTPDYSEEYLSYSQPTMDSILSTCLNTYIQEWMNKSSQGPSSIERVVIRDHVTGAIVGYYQQCNPTEEELNLHQDDSYYFIENGLYYELIFEAFQIRKNYVFYVTLI